MSSKIRLMLVGFVAALVVGGGSANADFIWGTPTNLGTVVNSSSEDVEPTISTDGLSLFFSSNRTGGKGGFDLWVATRSTVSDQWDPPVNLGLPVNSSSDEFAPSISTDGLSLYFADGRSFGANSTRSGGLGNADIWVTTRASLSDPWTPPVNLGPGVNGPHYDGEPEISTDGLVLFFDSGRPGGNGAVDLWMSTRATTSEPWGEPVNLGPIVNSSGDDGGPNISTDGLVLFFGSGRTGWDIWFTTRATISDPWQTPVNLGSAVNSSDVDAAPSISTDGATLFFLSRRFGGFGNEDLWRVLITPIVDFNGDGVVDSADMCMIVDYWGTDESLCDIGPTPLGDGIIDVQDLIALSEYLTKDVNDATLAAHWALDEAEGDIAYDSVGLNDAFVIGGALWQPDSGMVDGALQLDGVDDYVITGAAPNPADGPFSVLAWIKGGAPGLVVISQSGGGVNWLLADPTEGNLMTELQGTGRSGKPLQSQTNIIDGDWHRIGLTWDGSNRILYVDGIAVAQDTQPDLGGSDNGLYLGCGKAMEAGTYWSGLIDDVRIYNRVVIP